MALLSVMAWRSRLRKWKVTIRGQSQVVRAKNAENAIRKAARLLGVEIGKGPKINYLGEDTHFVRPHVNGAYGEGFFAVVVPERS